MLCFLSVTTANQSTGWIQLYNRSTVSHKNYNFINFFCEIYFISKNIYFCSTYRLKTYSNKNLKKLLFTR